MSLRALRKGRLDGIKAGWQQGYWLGRAESIIRNTQESHIPYFGVRMLFVRSGGGEPFLSIERSLLSILQSTTAEVREIGVHDDVPGTALAWRPDVVLVFSGYYLPIEQIYPIKQAGIKTVIWLTDDPYTLDVTLNKAIVYDHIFTQESNCVPLYQSFGCRKVTYLPLAADRTIYRPQYTDSSYEFDICFLGVAFVNRVALFDALAPYLSKKKVLIAGLGWEKLKNYRLLKKSIRGNQWMTPNETAKYYCGSKIVINMHRPYDEPFHNENSKMITAKSINPRTFEIASCGAFQLTDIREDLSLSYKPHHEVETFRDVKEFMEKADYYLTHEEDRRRIALAGLARTLLDHSYLRRVTQLMGAIVQQS
ncbi:CgeB family protein [Paenibacillus arenilitoris]|uniref:Glycosyltransferase n=1 Tax=Paenibacillus arenilitoris TaxID=2772299 RepID=A0A927H7E6_9BACL|nr:glycosyltransferase [Paenibacillus arenilitoris]MBD2871531.1 glycosyltransferase [Paenibacillus arenilitoris]